MAISDGEIVKAVIEFALADGSLVQNVFHFLANFVTDQTKVDVLAAVEGYIEDFYNAVSTYLADDFTVGDVTVDKIAWNATEELWEVTSNIGTASPTITHTNTDDPFPNQIAPVLIAHTIRPKSRGRKFLMGFVDTAANGSSLVSGALTALANALAVYLADEVVTTGNVLSPGVPRTNVNTFLELSTGAVNSVVGTQRRRKPGVGG